MIPLSHYQEAARAIRERTGGRAPKTLLILGSGLGFLGDRCEDAAAVPYEQIPHMRTSSAPGHRGRLVLGRLAGVDVAVMQGRIHFYEGYDFDEIAFLPRVARLLGAESLLVTNAAGGLAPEFSTGDMMLITDHINLTGQNPLRGPNLPEFGPRFPDMSYTYTPACWRLAENAAEELGIVLRRGVYMMFPGPSYETPAEIRAARALGADAVGMTTVPEVIVARHAGMRVLGISLISNLAAGLSGDMLGEQEVIAAAEAARDSFSALILKCLPAL